MRHRAAPPHAIAALAALLAGAGCGKGSFQLSALLDARAPGLSFGMTLKSARRRYPGLRVLAAGERAPGPAAAGPGWLVPAGVFVSPRPPGGSAAYRVDAVQLVARSPRYARVAVGVVRDALNREPVEGCTASPGRRTHVYLWDLGRGGGAIVESPPDSAGPAYLTLYSRPGPERYAGPLVAGPCPPPGT